MSITSLEYCVLRELHQRKLLPSRPKLLELGLNEWYGDVPVSNFLQDLSLFVPDPARRVLLVEKITEIDQSGRPEIAYEMARVFLQVCLDPSSSVAIDPGTGRGALPLDLNHPVNFPEPFDIVLNLGTAEHIFNIGRFFQTVHECTREGGLMIHHSPFYGWPDHGFYCIQPTVFWDLARANEYELLAFLCGQFKPFNVKTTASRDEMAALIKSKSISMNSVLSVVFRKSAKPRPFEFPTQGVYTNMISEEVRRNWFYDR